MNKRHLILGEPLAGFSGLQNQALASRIMIGFWGKHCENSITAVVVLRFFLFQKQPRQLVSPLRNQAAVARYPFFAATAIVASRVVSPSFAATAEAFASDPDALLERNLSQGPNAIQGVAASRPHTIEAFSNLAENCFLYASRLPICLS